MIRKKHYGLLSGLLYSFLFGPIFAGVVYSLLPQPHHPALKYLMLAVSVVVFYFVGVWVVTRQAELDRKIPIPSHELRRRRKEFYNWLAAQGRPWKSGR